MKNLLSRVLLGASLTLSLASLASATEPFTFKVVASGLNKPTGIVAAGGNRLFFTEIPTPGVAGGANAVKELRIKQNKIRTIHQGEPEPVNITIDHCDVLYWTCKSAGVILHQDEDGVIAPLLTGLNKPVGIALNRTGRLLYWTEVPTPGVAGTDGGQNKIWQYNLKTGVKTLVHSGDPEPTDITVAANGSIYWTCTSAGVIVEASMKHY
jgi:hypothetical protein